MIDLDHLLAVLQREEPPSHHSVPFGLDTARILYDAAREYLVILAELGRGDRP
jgi:hypothetical protein